MATLIANAWIDGEGYGPGFGNADAVPADVAAKIDADAWLDGPPKPPAKRASKAKDKPSAAEQAKTDPSADPFAIITGD